MAGYDINYDGLNELSNEFLFMNNALKEDIREVAKEIGTELKRNTEASIPRRAEGPKHGVHLADDVKMSVSVNDKKATITVKGGKKTGSLWWNVDNGHIAKNGKFVPGVHFTDIAHSSVDVEGHVNKLIENLVRSE